MGVSGSGKSTLGRALAERMGGTFLDADDFHPEANVEKMRAGIALNDDDRAPWLVALNRELIRRRENKQQVVLACSALKARYRDVLASGLPHLDWVFLDGDAAVIAARMAARSGHYMPPSLLASQLAALERPMDAVLVDLSHSTSEQLAAVFAALAPRGA